jgi:hypothetical protein
MRQAGGWLLAAAITLVVLVLCALVVPLRMHPPLSTAQLQQVATPEKRIELQQDQDRLRNDFRNPGGSSAATGCRRDAR